jgi:transcriptional regulator with XRE-family HTH domain
VTAPDNHDAHDYAERIRERLPRRLQELCEACGLSKYALWQKTGVSRDMIGRIEGGESIPTFHVGARLAYGVDKTLTEFVKQNADAWQIVPERTGPECGLQLQPEPDSGRAEQAR